jgi:hypothetical protein
LIEMIYLSNFSQTCRKTMTYNMEKSKLLRY